MRKSYETLRIAKKDTNFAAENIFQLIWHKKPVDIQNENSDQRKTSSDFVLLSVFCENYLFFPKICGK